MTWSANATPAPTAPGAAQPDVSIVLACDGDVEALLADLQEVATFSEAHPDVSLELVVVAPDAGLLEATREAVSGVVMRTVCEGGAVPDLLELGAERASGRHAVLLHRGESRPWSPPAATPPLPRQRQPRPPVATRSRYGTRQDPHEQAEQARQLPLLLHSLSLAREVFEVVYAHHRVQAVVEVGVESGQVSNIYRELGADVVYCVDPNPGDDLRALLNSSQGLVLVEQTSPEVLPHLPVGDLYVIDGDHNYATVRAEVAWIMEQAPDAVVVLHDVLWPCSRRDMYYDPSSLQASDRLPSSPYGPLISHDGLDASGFRGDSFERAVRAGGEGNGVLTAIEDAIEAAADDWDLAIVPAIFGIGVLARRGTRTAELFEALKPYTGSSLLYQMENNRLALYTRVLELQEEAAAAHQLAQRAAAALDVQTRELAELRATGSEAQRLLAHQRGVIDRVHAATCGAQGETC